jgi:2-methylcitrate dehydratase
MFSRKQTCENLARYAVKASWDALSADVTNKVKDHLLDSLGCALGAMDARPIEAIRAEQEPYSNGPCSLIGGGSATRERAALDKQSQRIACAGYRLISSE